ncbi:unnamed protein product [Lepidochelys kempii]
MDKLLRPHTSYAAAYLDDVIIHTPDWGTHLEKVEAVLRTLRRADLTANPAKCALGLAEARYLGYIVGRGIVKPQMHKLEAIQNWPRPTRKKQVRAFPGVVGYYQRFIPHFATRASPLTDLVKARGPDMVKWTDAAEGAFTDLRTALCNDPVLTAPDFNREFILQTDASEVGLGAVLSQMVGEKEHLILYLSRKLLPREQKYAVVKRECLAVKWAMETLRYYLLGRRFTLVMDHASLQWMQRNKEKHARVTRWFLSLQPFPFRIRHRAGCHHGNADGLSRAYCLASQVAQLYGVEQRRGICDGARPDGYRKVVGDRYISSRLNKSLVPG